MGFLSVLEVIGIILIALVMGLLPFVALVDILRSEFKGRNKLVWVVVIIFFNFIGSIVYFLIGYKHKLK